jgi:hypothetical protein
MQALARLPPVDSRIASFILKEKAHPPAPDDNEKI